MKVSTITKMISIFSVSLMFSSCGFFNSNPEQSPSENTSETVTVASLTEDTTGIEEDTLDEILPSDNDIPFVTSLTTPTATSLQTQTNIFSALPTETTPEEILTMLDVTEDTTITTTEITTEDPEYTVVPDWMQRESLIVQVHKVYDDHFSVILLNKYEDYDANSELLIYPNNFSDISFSLTRGDLAEIKFTSIEDGIFQQADMIKYNGSENDIENSYKSSFKGTILDLNEKGATVSFDRGNMTDLNTGEKITVIYPNIIDNFKKGDFIKIFFSGDFDYSEPYIVYAEAIEYAS